MRGRMLALWQVAFQGTTPVGGPVIGWIIALTDPRIGLAVGGASCFAAAIGGAGLARRYRRAEAPAPTVGGDDCHSLVTGALTDTCVPQL
jgi:hypothetical protein